MTERRVWARFLADTSGLVRSDERMILLFLLLLSIAALAVFLHYTTLVLGGLPEPLPTEPIGP
ncbi:hypothetical protein C464_10848 [Halorubrum coriense DSM 10284]|uniref:Uncharacterized protein n=1 Tax=Halorubrum coriense DSM 10284 TaxID=1227466 RepID=M0EHD0_9EURY|nr:hypothetical protein [Halorubrum coriense]ELZ46307.1 hypothetical protein C464_10848 [Halorubrum coriense DSM 10284]